jgi:hypothetical protein
VRFVIFVIDGASNSATGNEMEAIDAFNNRLSAGNYLLLAAGIAEPGRATLIDNRAGAGIETQGSLFTAPEHYSGFWIISAESEEQAKAFAREGSAMIFGSPFCSFRKMVDSCTPS